MSAPPRSPSIPGLLPPPPMAPPAMGPPLATRGPAPVIAEVRPGRSTGATRSAKAALLLSGLIAVAGVSFSLGRLTANDVEAGPQSPFGAAPAALAGTPRSITDDGAATDVSTSGGTSGAGESSDVMAGLATVEASTTDAAISATEFTATPGEALGAGDQASEAGARGAMPQLTDGAAGPAVGAFGGPPGGGAGRGGIEGTIAELSGSELMLTLADGSTRSVALDTNTTWFEQQPITVADAAVGDTVSVELPFGGFGAAEDEAAPTVAAQVTVISTAP